VCRRLQSHLIGDAIASARVIPVKMCMRKLGERSALAKLASQRIKFQVRLSRGSRHGSERLEH
jgi:hypothetical protein